MDAERQWESFTLKQLNQTLPFDTGTAILFVRELKSERTSGVKITSPLETTESNYLTGNEARSIYESIVTSCGKDNELKVQDKPEKRVRCNKDIKRQPIMKKKVEVLHSISNLFRFAQDGDLPQLATALSTGQYDINTKDQFDWTLLMMSSAAGHMHLVQYLLDEGAEWEGLWDKRNMDAVSLARIKGHHDVAEYILQHRVNHSNSSVQTSSGNQYDESDSKSTPSSFRCDICQQVIRDTPTSLHSTSIAHQFSCKHECSTLPYTLPQTNKGFQMMIRSGWDPGSGLGSEGQGRRLPVKTVLKRDRLGVGVTTPSNVPRVTHFRPGDVSAIRNGRERRMRKCSTSGGSNVPRNKKEREKLLRKERRWEIGIRQYMSTDY